MRQIVHHPAHFAGGLRFAESPLWHGGTLFVSDTRDGVVVGYDAHGEEVVTVEIDGHPNGLGVLADGRIVAASLGHGVLFTVEARPRLFADLGSRVTGTLGDLTTSADGRVFVDDIGYSPRLAEPHRPGRVFVLDDAGAIVTTIEGLEFPNGLVHDTSRDELIIAETFASRLSRCALGDRNPTAAPWIDLEELCGAGAQPDGISVDAHGRLWVCLPFQQRCVAIAPDGRVEGAIELLGEHPIACTSGDRPGLFVTVAAPTTGRDRFVADLAAGVTKSRIVFAPFAGLEEET